MGTNRCNRWSCRMSFVYMVVSTIITTYMYLYLQIPLQRGFYRMTRNHALLSSGFYRMTRNHALPGFYRMTRNHAFHQWLTLTRTCFQFASLLYVVSSWPQTNTCKMVSGWPWTCSYKVVLRWPRTFTGIHMPLQGLHTPTLGVIRYKLSKDHYKKHPRLAYNLKCVTHNTTLYIYSKKLIKNSHNTNFPFCCPLSFKCVFFFTPSLKLYSTASINFF